MKHSKCWKRDFTYDNLFNSFSLFTLSSFHLSSLKVPLLFAVIVVFSLIFSFDTCDIPSGRCRHPVLENPFLVIFSLSLVFLYGIHFVCVSIKFWLWQSKRIVRCSSCSFYIYFRFRSSLANHIVHRLVIGSLEIKKIFFFFFWSAYCICRSEWWVRGQCVARYHLRGIQRSFSLLFSFIWVSTQFRFIA